MTASNTAVLSRIPSLRSLLFFEAAGRHLNLVRAAEELRLTQSALSRQIKGLEDHLGVQLFQRGPRGLRFTEEGELLFDYASRAFRLMNQGVNSLASTGEQHTLVVSAARSFAQRVLASRIGEFVALHPQVQLRIDVHRYYADLESSGADISIRLGRGDWHDYEPVKITSDVLVPVCAPSVADEISKEQPGNEKVILLRNRERDYVGYWAEHLERADPLQAESRLALEFNDSATVLSMLENGVGLTIMRASLVADALQRGSLVRPFVGELKDGMDYYAIQSQRSRKNALVKLFMTWLTETFDNDYPQTDIATSSPR